MDLEYTYPTDGVMRFARLPKSERYHPVIDGEHRALALSKHPGHGNPGRQGYTGRVVGVDRRHSDAHWWRMLDRYRIGGDAYAGIYVQAAPVNHPVPVGSYVLLLGVPGHDNLPWAVGVTRPGENRVRLAWGPDDMHDGFPYRQVVTATHWVPIVSNIPAVLLPHPSMDAEVVARLSLARRMWLRDEVARRCLIRHATIQGWGDRLIRAFTDLDITEREMNWVYVGAVEADFATPRIEVTTSMGDLAGDPDAELVSATVRARVTVPVPVPDTFTGLLPNAPSDDSIAAALRSVAPGATYVSQYNLAWEPSLV